ncbi:MAG: alpha/beta hydrolase [Myxococcota bacterium]
MDIRRTEGRFEGAGGRSLFRRSWLSESPERVLVVAHGFAEHSGRYEPFGRWFAESGCAVHGYDHQGHGRSTGPRNYVASFADYLDDLGAFLDVVVHEHPGLEVVLVGHSMGGLITAGFARERKPDVLGVVLSGPALALGQALSGPSLWFVKLLRHVAPRFLANAGLPVDGLSRDSEVQRLYEEDPLVDTRMTPALALAMRDACERTDAGGAQVEVPMLLLHGADDPLCSPSGSEVFFASLPAGSAPPSALKVYPGLLHEIFNEPEREEVFADLLGWVRSLEESRSSKAAGANA